MFRKILFLLFFFIILIFVSPTHAFAPFIKSLNNPLPLTNNFPNWNEAAQYQPSVIFDNGIFKMWYASATGSQYKIVYATSNDGINWIRQNLLDVYPSFDNHDPAILKTQSGYTLFFVATTNVGSQNFKIYSIDSSDGVNFDPNSRQLVLQPSGSLESSAVSSPSVIYENGSYYLFYLCWGSQGFRICMATSSDGNTWQRCSNNPITSEVSDGPHILTKDGKYYLFFQSPLGVRQAESSNNLSCSMTWLNLQTVLPEPILGPSVFDKQDMLYLYYSGFYQDGIKLSLATSNNQPTSTPTPSLTPTPNPRKRKIIIVHGHMASWNKEAMLHNKKVSQNEWKLLPFVKEYNGLIHTLENLGYVKNQDFFIFAYDWRKNLEKITEDLKNFRINHNLANTQIDLVGHSLGGLVSRIYIQKYETDLVDKIVTAGSPHLGTAKTYKLVEAGELDKDNTVIWLMQKLILQINRSGFQTDRQTANSVIPVAKDLFPIYDFLLDKQENSIPLQYMKIKNDTLLNYSSGFPQLFPQLSTLAGDKGNNTLFGYKVIPRTFLDILLGNYPDGRPIEKRNSLGDNVISLNSALAGNDQVTLSLDHGEIIYKNQSISTILDKLTIPYSQSQIREGASTKISPALIFALLSPAIMEVNFLGQRYEEQDGLIFIENAPAGDYELKVRGKYPGGQYTVIVGQIADNDDRWFEIDGEINKIFPMLQTDSYTIAFDPENLQDFPVNQKNLPLLFRLLIKRLTNLKKDCGSSIETILKKIFSYLRSPLLQSHSDIFNLRKRASLICKNKLYSALTQFENLYEKASIQERYLPKRQDLEKKLSSSQNQYKELETYLISQQSKGVNVLSKAVSLSQMQEKLQKAEEELSKNNLPLAEILLYSAERLGKEIR
ncbi:hypothetical protein A3C98_03545 [Candidatus Roizmanbacteria bacterium RIFCSPHIGHO2_02_FULL_37_15]|uniref:DUF676 domain-containing protein n=1 Tax=Candidatus Roizmanbacteria bacterium RIFCSPLOWO2_01_FULL_37_16 TaxID=1802058 RepID=A0A1F7IIV7_9BACT|nr:MAG: hypothetical protein A2859_05180 [Candidatus Roizmanbacteria bacterium RIFCSPHIGHO2_01_FULL_37_16b]OGK20447.1 MAG: hypothetical protein A3C98_03545 [Candidatus Roizmanbacteria bacterium RIFCSPHIGHO2_02_FULL_37_15]OGK43298.1 MAG: hypothetical protein A3B40_02290 [Candidatus Roizmanbacteria bacterium RIFCSPLOWO2_01_FULL_37_16]